MTRRSWQAVEATTWLRRIGKPAPAFWDGDELEFLLVQMELALECVVMDHIENRKG